MDRIYKKILRVKVFKFRLIMKKTILNSHKTSELETIPKDNKIVKKISQAFTKEKVNKIILKKFRK